MFVEDDDSCSLFNNGGNKIAGYVPFNPTPPLPNRWSGFACGLGCVGCGAFCDSICILIVLRNARLALGRRLSASFPIDGFVVAAVKVLRGVTPAKSEPLGLLWRMVMLTCEEKLFAGALPESGDGTLLLLLFALGLFAFPPFAFAGDASVDD